MSRKPKVSIYLRIRLDGRQIYHPVVWESKKCLKDHYCLIDGVEEHRPDGVYYLRYRVNGKQVWESVEGFGHSVLNLRAQRIEQIAHPNASTSRRFTERYKPEPAKEEERHRLDEEIKIYLGNVEKLAPRTHAAYKSTLALFQQSCKAIFIHQITKQNLQAFDSFLHQRGDEDRTRANRIQRKPGRPPGWSASDRREHPCQICRVAARGVYAARA